MIRNQTRSFRTAIAALAIFACASVSGAQRTSESPQASTPASGPSSLEEHLDELTSKVDSMRQQLKESQSAMEDMRNELNALRAQLAEKTQSEEAAQSAASLRASVEQLQDQTDVLQAEVQQHDQIKVESASKYPLRISGMLLFTSLLNGGRPDNIDLPVIAMPKDPDGSSGSLSATPRQTVLGIDASGPHLWGARSSADLSVDFFGASPYANYATASGGIRLRTAHARLEWPDRAITVAFDRPLISPWQPTSWLTVGQPALAGAGNLWLWSPQLEFKENAILPNRRLGVEFGLIDPPAPGTTASTGLRAPDASERSRTPGYEARVSAALSWLGRPMNLGAGGYYSRQSYSYDRHVDAWAGTADGDISLARAVEISGEFYRGRAIGGLGGGAFKDYVLYPSHGSYGSLRGLNAAGGWAQFKFKIGPLLEANVAAGQDDALMSDLRNSDLVEGQNYANLARNQSALGNLVFRPRSYLLFSTEFRQIKSWPISGLAYRDRMLGLAAGYSF
jgi:hypothetical protein